MHKICISSQNPLDLYSIKENLNFKGNVAFKKYIFLNSAFEKHLKSFIKTSQHQEVSKLFYPSGCSIRPPTVKTVLQACVVSFSQAGVPKKELGEPRKQYNDSTILMVSHRCM